MLRLRADIRSIPEVVGYPTYHDVQVTSPFTTGMRESQESEPKSAAHTTRGRHIVPPAFDVYGRWREKADAAVKKAARQRLEASGELKEHETLRCTATAWQDEKNIASKERTK